MDEKKTSARSMQTGKVATRQSIHTGSNSEEARAKIPEFCGRAAERSPCAQDPASEALNDDASQAHETYVGRCAAVVRWSPKIRRLEPRSGRRAVATGETKFAVEGTECNLRDQTPSARHRPKVGGGMSDPSSNPTAKSPSACTGPQRRGAVGRWRWHVGDRGVPRRQTEVQRRSLRCPTDVHVRRPRRPSHVAGDRDGRGRPSYGDFAGSRCDRGSLLLASTSTDHQRRLHD